MHTAVVATVAIRTPQRGQGRQSPLATVQERERRGHDEQHGTRGCCEDSRHVAAGQLARPDVHHVESAVGHGERPDDQGECSPDAGAAATEREQHQRYAQSDHQQRREVSVNRHAGLAVQHRVVERVQQSDGGGSSEDA